MPMKARRRSSSGSAFTCAPSGVAPSGSAGASAIGAERQPVHRRTAIGRGFELLAERRAQRLLETGLDRQRIEQRRPQRIGGRLQRRGDARFLGAQLGELGVALLQRLGGSRMARFGSLTLGGARLLHLDALGLGLGHGLAGGFELVALGLAGGLDRLLALAARFLERGTGGFERGLDLRQRRQARQARSRSRAAARRFPRGAPSRRRRRSCSSAISRLTLLRSASSSAIWRVRRSCSPSAATVASCASSRACWAAAARSSSPTRSCSSVIALGVEIGDGGIGVALAALLARQIGLGLLQALLGVLLGGGDALGFGAERIVRRAQALEGGGGGGLVVAQRRQRGRGIGLRRRGKTDQAREIGDLGLGFLQPLARLGQLALGVGQLQRQDGGFGAADMVGEVAIAAGLARLALQPLVLLFERHQHVLHARKVLLGGAQAQLGLVAAGIKAGDAGRLVDHAAAIDGLGVDQRADAALADQRGRARAGRGIGKQRLHVAGADLLPLTE